jgi:uncharacterized membrane protein YcaP (DUF421 family)
MQPVFRAFAVYAVLLVIFRLAGKRTLSETSSFDLVLLLIISETTQEAMIGDDYSMTNAVVLIVSLVGIDISLSFLKQRSPFIERWLDGRPLVILRRGKPLLDRMNKERVDLEDVLEAARKKRGLSRTEEIELAVLERHGDITIVPKRTK